ncbi:MAG: hypothetical protein ACK4YP_18850, partial [Myxococcota bacterium]
MANPGFPADIPDLLRQDRLAGVGALAAGLAQEVDNPLASVLSALECLQNRLRRGESVGEESLSLVGDALDATRRATGLVRDLRILTAAPAAGTLELPDVLHAAARVATTMTGLGTRLAVGCLPAVSVADVL